MHWPTPISSAASFAATAIVFCACFLAQPASGRQRAGGCHAPSAESTGGLGWLASLVAARDTSSVAFRKELRISATSASQLSLVTADSICTAVAKARAAEMHIRYDSVAMYVYKVGNVYVADEHVGSSNSGILGYRPMHFFDLHYNFLAIGGR